MGPIKHLKEDMVKTEVFTDWHTYRDWFNTKNFESVSINPVTFPDASLLIIVVYEEIE